MRVAAWRRPFPGGDGQGDPGKTPDTSKPAASPKPAGTADDG